MQTQNEYIQLPPPEAASLTDVCSIDSPLGEKKKKKKEKFHLKVKRLLGLTLKRLKGRLSFRQWL